MTRGLRGDHHHGIFQDFWADREPEIREARDWLEQGSDRVMLLTGHRGNGLSQFIRMLVGGKAVYINAGDMLEAGGAADDSVFLAGLCRSVGYWPRQGMDRQLSALLDIMLPGSGKLSRENEVLVAVQRILFSVTKALLTWQRRHIVDGDSRDTPLFVITGFTADNKERRQGFFDALVSWAAYVSEAKLARVVFVADSSFGEPAILTALKDRPERLSVLQLQDASSDSVKRILERHFGSGKSPDFLDEELVAVGGRYRDIAALVDHMHHNVDPHEAVRWLVEGAEVTARRLLMNGQPGSKWTRPQLWRAIRLLSTSTGVHGVPYDVFLWGVFRGDESALRSMKESNLISIQVRQNAPSEVTQTSGLSRPLRYEVTSGSPLFAEVFRRLIQNEGLSAVLDLEVAKEDIKREQNTIDGYEAELMRLEEISDVRRDWWFTRRSSDQAIEDRKSQLVSLVQEQHRKLEKYHKARLSATVTLSRTHDAFQKEVQQARASEAAAEQPQSSRQGGLLGLMGFA
ncbi:unnamed protein product [Polarella glacialis]|uniref:Mitochondrial escape protein 2 C-terminal domain-containing protein n=1 Tax=Polarella glacialis TaxID=89957 RepID=A0A813FZR4_POLGL|nr:unnamed protein product [Polarella glacialis]